MYDYGCEAFFSKFKEQKAGFIASSFDHVHPFKAEGRGIGEWQEVVKVSEGNLLRYFGVFHVAERFEDNLDDQFFSLSRPTGSALNR